MKKALALFALVLAAVALVACGGDDDDDGGDGATTAPSNGAATGGGGGGAGGGGGGETVQLAADPDGALAFDTDQLSASAGSVTIELDNPAAVAHDVALESPAGEDLGASDTVAEGTTTLQLEDLQPGEYTFYCSVPGHREGGMEGTLTVK
ncbi:MAG: plastocyanin/azurin family copper-binding protein [Solirubrobacterales bacterium]